MQMNSTPAMEAANTPHPTQPMTVMIFSQPGGAVGFTVGTDPGRTR